MVLGRGSVVGFQNCNVHTYKDDEAAVEAGDEPYPLLSVFGNVEGSVAQVSQSTVFFPREVRLNYTPLLHSSPRLAT